MFCPFFSNNLKEFPRELYHNYNFSFLGFEFELKTLLWLFLAYLALRRRRTLILEASELVDEPPEFIPFILMSFLALEHLELLVWKLCEYSLQKLSFILFGFSIFELLRERVLTKDGVTASFISLSLIIKGTWSNFRGVDTRRAYPSRSAAYPRPRFCIKLSVFYMMLRS